MTAYRLRYRLLLLPLLAAVGCASYNETKGSVAQGIVGGSPDFDRTAVVAVAVDIGTGWGHVCSGTLISPSVVLTAAHCFYPGDVAAVSFEQDIAPGWPIDTSVEMHTGSHVIHPGWKPNGQNGKQEDMAVVLLDAPVSIPPMPLAPEGSVNGLAPKDLVTVVGYGMDSATGLGNAGNNSWTNERRSATTSVKTVNKALLQTNANLGGTGGGCFGDSGGATLAEIAGTEVLAGVTVIGDGSCVQLMQAARTDTPIARQFLGQFVQLP